MFAEVLSIVEDSAIWPATLARGFISLIPKGEGMQPMQQRPLAVLSQQYRGNAMHAVRTQCEVLDVGKYSNPSFGPFSQVFGSIPGFFWLPKHLGCGIFELSTVSP